MREFKFRAWDEKQKIIHNNFRFIKSGDTPMDWIIFQSDIQKKSIKEIIDSPFCAIQLRIMQFTGLLDKNSKEIYEGDIVKIFSEKNSFEFAKIIFNKGCFEYYNLSEFMTGMITVTFFREGVRLCETQSGYIEIIGNIYENQEILEKTNER